MLSIRFKSGFPVADEVLREMQINPHRVECVIYARTENAGVDEWTRIPVSQARVTVNDPGTPADLQVTTVPPLWFKRETTDANGDPVIVPFLSRWDNESEITPWGTWLQVFQFVYVPGLDRPGDDDYWGDDDESLDDPIVIPWGAFVVTDVVTEANTQTINAKDTLAMMEFRSYVQMSLARVVKGDNLGKRVDDLVSQAWPTGTDPWLAARPWDTAAAPGRVGYVKWQDSTNGVVAKTTDQYDGEDRLQLVRNILARNEFDLRSPTSKYDLAMVITADQDGLTHLYTVRREFDIKDPDVDAIRDIKSGQGLVSLKEIKGRGGVVNRAIVTWDASLASDGSVVDEDDPRAVKRQQYRTKVDLVALANEDFGKVYVGQRFGLHTRDESASGIVSEIDAVRKGRRMILRSLLEASSWEVDCSPVYGLQVDDVVSLRDAYGNTGYGRVIGLSVGLTQADRWTLEVQPLNPVDAKSFGNVDTDRVDAPQVLQWRSIYSRSVNEGMKTNNGWKWDSSRVSVAYTKTGCRATASGPEFGMWTAEVYRSPDGIARASVEVGKVPEKLEVQVRLTQGNANVAAGPWVTVLRGTSETVSSGQLSIDRTKQFGVHVVVRGLGSNGAKVDLNGITVEVPGIARSDPDDGSPSGTPGSATDGNDIITRAKSWVTAGVAYSQSAYYRNSYGNYRTDCSGFVSMAWGLGSSYVTSTLPQVSRRITKDQLQAGDILLDTARHAVIFEKWANAAHTEYWGYEQTPPRAQYHKLPYPYWAGRGYYVPYRRR